MPAKSPVIVVAGPTATGKSGLALAIAAEFAGTVVNADSMQVYRELRILTARPGRAEMSRAPHRLYGFRPADTPCSVGQWLALARQEIAAAHREGRLPVLVGGTGMYLRALLRGLANIPDIPEPVRREARDRLARDGAIALHAALAERDPEMAARLPPGDSQRLVRAWEVLQGTGRSLAEWQRDAVGGNGLRPCSILLMPPREAVYAACDARFLEMMRRGALREAQAIAAGNLDPALPACRAVGLRPLLRHLAGTLSRDEAIRLAQRDTRRLARRQMTWFRHQMMPDLMISEQYSERLNDKIFPFISDFLLTVAG